MEEEDEETADAATPTNPHAVEDVDDAPEPEPSAPEAAAGPVLLAPAPLKFPGYAPAEPPGRASPPTPATQGVAHPSPRAGPAYPCTPSPLSRLPTHASHQQHRPTPRKTPHT